MPMNILVEYTDGTKKVLHSVALDGVSKEKNQNPTAVKELF
jgi:hypothetical protein